MSQEKDIRKDWQTPIAEMDVAFLRLLDDVELGLSIFFAEEITLDQPPVHYCFRWKRFVAYRNIVEEACMPWDMQTNPRRQDGSYPTTNIVEASSWIAELRMFGDSMDFHYPGVRHYVILNSSYSTEVISNVEPEITRIR